MGVEGVEHTHDALECITTRKTNNNNNIVIHTRARSTDGGRRYTAVYYYDVWCVHFGGVRINVTQVLFLCYAPSLRILWRTTLRRGSEPAAVIGRRAQGKRWPSLLLLLLLILLHNATIIIIITYTSVNERRTCVYVYYYYNIIQRLRVFCKHFADISRRCCVTSDCDLFAVSGVNRSYDLRFGVGHVFATNSSSPNRHCTSYSVECCITCTLYMYTYIAICTTDFITRKLSPPPLP